MQIVDLLRACSTGDLAAVKRLVNAGAPLQFRKVLAHLHG